MDNAVRYNHNHYLAERIRVTLAPACIYISIICMEYVDNNASMV